MDQVGTIWELAMTTKELCDALRHTHPSRTMCKEAANVIERLARELDKAQRLCSDMVRSQHRIECRLAEIERKAPW
jgi:hypothetical protein